MAWTELLGFIILMAVGQFAPGPDMLLLTRTALSEGRSAGVWMAIGIASGLLFHAGFAVAGMAYLLQTHVGIAMVVRVLASLYLAWIAYALVKASFGPSLEFSKNGETRKSRRNHWLRGFLCNVLNLKVVVFLSTVVLPFLSEDRASWWPWLLAFIIVVEGALLWSLWVLVLQNRWVREGYRRIWRWLDRVFAVLLIGLSVSLLHSVFIAL